MMSPRSSLYERAVTGDLSTACQSIRARHSPLEICETWIDSRFLPVLSLSSQREMMTSCAWVMKMTDVWSTTLCGNHNLWSRKRLTSSPRKFHSSTSFDRSARKHWCSYRKMKARGVLNLFSGTLMTDEESRSTIQRGASSCLRRSFWLNCSITSIFFPTRTSWRNSRSTCPDSIERILSGTCPPPVSWLRTSSMIPGEILISWICASDKV
mmetsp:Transcript_53174/g.113636  ORF Transcript_53174/g.113636 Transcript_53174/m.113636 type:complete len:211 (-) Transcript_53174:392-1024(-)